MTPLFYISLGMLIAFIFFAIIQKNNQIAESNLVYNYTTNQIGLIIFDDTNDRFEDYYRIHKHGVWSKTNCIRLSRKQCNKLLSMSSTAKEILY